MPVIDGVIAPDGETVDIILPPPSTAPTPVVHDIEIDDDRNLIHPGDAVLLIVEDDVTFARILVDLAHDRGIKVLVALRGGTALSLAREFSPRAITLDINLPDMAGWTILDRLKHDPATRHIPVHVITGDENRRRGLALGAMSYLEKSVTKDNLTAAFDAIHHSLERRTRKLLIVAESDARRNQWEEELGGSDVETLAVGIGWGSPRGGQPEIPGRHRDRHLRSPTFPPRNWWKRSRRQLGAHTPPILICGPAEPGADADAEIRNLGRHSVVRYVDSLERLLEETVLFLHRAEIGSLRVAAGDPGLGPPYRCQARGQERSGSGRRCAQHFCAHHRPRTAWPAGGSRGEWPRGHRDAAEHARHRRRPDGHHDAGDGWLRNHAGDPPDSRSSARFPSSR